SLWEEELVRMQGLLTDEVIENAFQTAWPQAVYDIDGPRIVETLKERRDNLRNFATAFYKKKAQAVDVIGTEEQDYFLVERFSNGDVKVRVWGAKKDGTLKNQYYERTFKKGETKEVRLYGLGKKDRFEFKGEATDGPIIRAIGGLGEDQFQDKVQRGGVRKNLIYDAKSLDIDYERGKSSKLLLKEDPKYNTYNRKSLDYQFDFVGIVPSLTFNPDDGFLVGGTANIRKYGFQKAPFSSAHKIDLRYAVATGGWLLNYQGEWIDRIKKWDLLFQTHFQTPFYTGNFYGFGNDTRNFEETFEDEDEGNDFHRLRLREVDIYFGFMRKNQTRYFSIGPVFQSIRAELSDNRFITTVAQDIDPETFDGLEYAGAKAVYSYANTDQGGFPAYGIKAYAEAAYLQQLDNSEISYPYIKGAFTLYRHLDANKQLVFATRVGGQYTFNNEFTIFQGAVLGGIGRESNFRGFRRDRYRGKASFYQNIDLRWKLNSNNNALLPFSSGLIAGFDHGRVWLDGEDSDTWHYSFGGGIFLNPFDQIAISFTAFHTDNNITRFVFSGGFFF
ncbi:MAG: ShlB/FhaC/HecB family hemolysin secretion/activation protein, partial [Bacteroidota bacterium]